MKKSFVSMLTVVSAVLVAVSGQAQAQTSAPSKMYAEFGYAALRLKATDSTDSIKASPSVLTGVFGYQFIPNLAVEGLVGLGAGNSSLKVNGVASGVNIKVSNAFGVFIRPSVSVADSVDLFARAGWLRTTLKVSDGVDSESDSDSSFAYGFGANFNLSKTSYIQANWMNYYKNDGLKVNGLAVAYGMRF